MPTHRFIYILIVLVSVSVYASAFSAPFQYDDFHFLKENLRIKSIDGFLSWVSGEGGFFGKRPLLLLTFLGNYLAGGLDTFAYHFVNLAIHVLVSCLIFALVLAVDEDATDSAVLFRAAAAALFFALHPVCTESVTYISGRSSSLSSLFVLLSLLLFVKATSEQFRPGLYLGSAFCFLAAVSAKESAIVLPLLLAAIEFVRKRKAGSLGSVVLYHLPFWFAVALGAFLYSGYVTSPEAPRSLATHGLTMVKVAAHAFRLSLIPVGQSIDYDIRPSSSLDGDVARAGLLLIGLCVLAFLARSRNRWVAGGLLWFFGALAPLFIVRLNDFMADRWLYLPLVGICIMVAEAVRAVPARLRLRWPVTVLLLVSFGLLTMSRNTVYASQVALWEDAAAKASAKHRPYANLARAYKEAGRYADAIAAARTAIAIDGREAEAYINLAAAYEAVGDYANALKVLQDVERRGAHFYSLYQNMGTVLERMGRHRDALKAFEAAYTIMPESPLGRFSIATAHENIGDTTQAMAWYRITLDAVPQHAQDYMARGIAYAKLGADKDANTAFREAVRSDPFDVNVRLFLAENYLGNGYFDDAFRQYQAAAKIAPHLPAGHIGMGRAMVAAGRPEAGRPHLRKALDLLPAGSAERAEVEALLSQ